MHAFISYEERDSLVAYKLKQNLEKRRIDAFMSYASIHSGESFVEKINTAIGKADLFVLIWSLHAATSAWVRQELNSALQLHTDSGKPTIFPILLDNTPLPPLINHFKAESLISLNEVDQVSRSIELTSFHRFDRGLINELRKFGRTVKRMTSDQCRVIDMLRHHKKTMSQGCAGSGKTVIAAEQAIRLSRAGLRTLLLCHNPVLARFLKQLTNNSSVEVWAFNKWVEFLATEEPSNIPLWSHYVEPVSKHLDIAASKLLSIESLYDAIVVDEGQDFREEWWILIEFALQNPNQGRLHIFADDNQMLLPLRSSRPMENAPFILSRNVRNGGAVFDLITSFHMAAPEPEIGLLHIGEVLVHPVKRREKAYRKLKWIISKRLRDVPASSIVILILNSSKVKNFIDAVTAVDGPNVGPLPKLMPLGMSSNNHIAVHGVDSFKGMESDLVILFIPARQYFNETHLYVAISRARLYLDIIADLDLSTELLKSSTLVKQAGISFANGWHKAEFY